jgi:hypothetical protein
LPILVACRAKARRYNGLQKKAAGGLQLWSAAGLPPLFRLLVDTDLKKTAPIRSGATQKKKEPA